MAADPMGGSRECRIAAGTDGCLAKPVRLGDTIEDLKEWVPAVRPSSKTRPEIGVHPRR
jgi:hypothetical protein